MLEDTDRLLGSVEQVLKASQVRQGVHYRTARVDFGAVVRDAGTRAIAAAFVRRSIAFWQH
jgi:hypothetical protein